VILTCLGRAGTDHRCPPDTTPKILVCRVGGGKQRRIMTGRRHHTPRPLTNRPEKASNGAGKGSTVSGLPPKDVFSRCGLGKAMCSVPRGTRLGWFHGWEALAHYYLALTHRPRQGRVGRSASPGHASVTTAGPRQARTAAPHGVRSREASPPMPWRALSNIRSPGLAGTSKRRRPTRAPWHGHTRVLQFVRGAGRAETGQIQGVGTSLSQSLPPSSAQYNEL